MIHPDIRKKNKNMAGGRFVRFKERIINLSENKLFIKLHVSEMIGIIAAFLMGVFSIMSFYVTKDWNMITSASFFFLMLAIRLVLFFWNLLTRHRSFAKLSQAVMMLVTAIVLYLIRVVLAVGIIWQMLGTELVAIFPFHTLMAVAYGLYTLGKFFFWIIGMKMNKENNRYTEVLSYLGWYSALYSVAHFIGCLFFAGVNVNSNLFFDIMFAVVLVSTVVLIILMLVKSIRSIYWFVQERRAVPQDAAAEASE